MGIEGAAADTDPLPPPSDVSLFMTDVPVLTAMMGLLLLLVAREGGSGGRSGEEERGSMMISVAESRLRGAAGRDCEIDATFVAAAKNEL